MSLRHPLLWRWYRRVRRGAAHKRNEELTFWRSRLEAEGTLTNTHYESFFTHLVGLDSTFYEGKDILDIGCGPRGSLVWANHARRRVGLDALVEDYRAFGIDRHTMEYVAGVSERMPFRDESFDVVTSFNSLDHVDDLDQTVAEIKRVTRGGGHFVFAVEVGHAPTWSEPQTLPWDLAETFSPEFTVLTSAEYERGEKMYDGAWQRIAFDHGDETPRSGLLTGVLQRL